jgi:hypothetical protein
VQSAQQAGAITGIGPKATSAKVKSAITDWSEKEKAINEYLTGLGVNINQAAEQTYISGINAMPGGPETAIVNRMGGVAGGNSWGQQLASMGSTIAQNIPWENLFNRRTSNTGTSNTGTTVTSGAYGNYNLTNPYYSNAYSTAASSYPALGSGFYSSSPTTSYAYSTPASSWNWNYQPASSYTGSTGW